MTARVLISCDAAHPDRTPPQCRAYLPTGTVYETVALEYAEASGWTRADDGGDLCPSCSRGAA